MEQMGKYQLVRKLATGGMAEVFLAKAAGPMGFEKTLVVKRILPHLAEDEEFTQMFLAEAQLAARLNHANVVQIFDFGEQDGAFFIAMEYVEGPNLRTLAKRAFQEGAPIPEPLCARLIALACEGLAYAHELTSPQGEPLNLIHRDISTDNILVSRTGGVKVVDFGIAKAANVGQRTRTGILKGKVAYMSPEHLLGKPMDARADIYALGIVLYELLAGRKPFEAESDVQLVQAILHESPADVRSLRADVPESMAHIVAKALAKDREERYLSCRDLQADLEHFIFQCGQPMSARHISELVRRLVPILPGDGVEAAAPQKTPRGNSRADIQAPAQQRTPPPQQQRTPPPQQQRTPPPQPEPLPEFAPLETKVTAPQQLTASSAVTAPRTASGVQAAVEPTRTAPATESETRILPGTQETQRTAEAAPELPAEWGDAAQDWSEDPSDSAPTIAANGAAGPEAYPPAVPSESVIVSTEEMQAPRTGSAAYVVPQEHGEDNRLGAQAQPTPSGRHRQAVPPRSATGERPALGAEGQPTASGRYRQAVPPRSTTGEQAALGAEGQPTPSGRYRQAVPPRSTTGETRVARTTSGAAAVATAQVAQATEDMAEQALEAETREVPEQEEPRRRQLLSWLVPSLIGAGVGMLLLLAVALFMFMGDRGGGPRAPVASVVPQGPGVASAETPAPTDPPPGPGAQPGTPSSPPTDKTAVPKPTPEVKPPPADEPPEEQPQVAATTETPPAPPKPVAKGLTLVLVESNLPSSVRINGKVIGDAPLEEPVKPGTRVRIEAFGTSDGQRFSKTQIVTLKPGEEREVRFELKKQKVMIRGRPANLEVVSVNGQPPLGKNEALLFEGKHQLELIDRASGKTYKTTCEVKGRLCKYVVK